MDQERASAGSSSHHHHYSHQHSNKSSTSPPITPTSSSFAPSNQHHHHSTTTTSSSDTTHHTRARSHSHSFHQNNNNAANFVNNSKNSNHHGSIPISATSSLSQSPSGGSTGGLGASGSSSGILGSATAAVSAAIGSRSMPSLKINMHQHSHHLDQFSRSITARARRFFRTYFSRTTTGHNNISTTSSTLLGSFTTTRRIRLRVLIPLAALTLWLLYLLTALVFRLAFGSRDHRYFANQPIQPPTWVDRGDITDLDLRPTEGANMMTAVLLNWSRLDSLKDIVEHLCPHIMFKEIMIWNNKVDVHIEEKMFTCPKVRVFNSPSNMFFVARYMACAMASAPYCYFQDDDWKIFYLRSMYANFLRFPQFLHTDTNSDVWALTNWRWCFFEAEIDIHACFSWLGTGAMATRESVVNFLKQASVTDMDPLEFAYGDMYFSTFLNQVPYQLENYLLELVDPAEDVAAFSKGSEGKTRNKLYMHKAAQKLWDALVRKDPAFEREELHPTYLERDVRSPCADDRCLIISNKHPFPDVSMFKYRPYIDIEESEKLHYHYMDPTPYIRHPFSKAVDGLDDTAYKSTQPIAKGDYIGIDMLLQVDRKIEFRLLHQMGDQWIHNARLEVAGSDAVYKTIPLSVSCKAVRNSQYRGKVPIDVEYAFLNQEMDNQIFDETELERIYERSNKNSQHGSKKPDLSYYEDYGWRTQCKFVVHESSGFRFMRLVSTRDERYPFVIYDLGWKVI